MSPHEDSTLSSAWTRGGDRVVFQSCGACAHTWYFHRGFCPACGRVAPTSLTSLGTGTVYASTLVQRAPSDEFRAIAPYRILLVDVIEGFRMMGHGERSLVIGDRVQCHVQTMAGRLLPFFNRKLS